MELPVFGVVWRAAWLLIANLFTLLRLAWLPIGVYMGTSYALVFLVVRELQPVDLESAFYSVPFISALFADVFLQVFAVSVVAVSVHRLVFFHDRRPNVYFSFPFGKSEFLYVLMATLSSLIVLAPFVFTAIGIGLLFVGDPGLLFFDEEFAPAEKAEFTAATAALIGGLFVSVIFASWLAYRLCLWPPAIVANNAFSLAEAWRLTRRKVWAQIAWSIVIASVILFILVGFVVGITSTRILSIVEATDFEYKFRSALSGNIDPNVLIVEFLFLFVTSTYAVAILSYAYKAMRGYDLDMPITDQRPLGPLQAFETSLTAQTAERVRAENQFSEHRMRDEA